MSRVAGRDGSLPRRAAVPRALVDLALYAAASGVALGIDYAILVALAGLGINYLCASAVSFCAGMGACYWLSVRFVFGDRRKASREAEMVGFVAVGLAGLALTQALLFALVSGAHLPVAVAKVPTAGLVFLFNFVARRGLVFVAPGRFHEGPATPSPDATLFDRLRRVSLTDVSLGVALAVVWGLGHPYVGIEGDARIYMGRALADLDPSGVGRDLAFLMDGQSAFTVFGTIAKALVGKLGLGSAAIALSLTNLTLWFAAIAIFARGLAPGRALALVLTLVVVLPRFYTPMSLFSAGEAIAVPRPLAEAGVILALAALCRDRFVVSAVCLVAAAVVHPIMAAPGFGVLLVVLGLRDRRWFAAAGLAALALVTAALAGAPLASRLLVTIDGHWRHILWLRNPYLFLSKWPIEPFLTALVQMVTILIGGALLEPRSRIVLWASAAVALVGCAASLLFCDLFSNLLVTQVQLWRWLWPVAALAPVAAGICVWRLPGRGINGHLALVSLCAAWLWMTTPLLACSLAPLALGLFLARPLPVRLALVPVFLAIVVILAALSEWDDLLGFAALIKERPGAATGTWAIIWKLGVAMVPLGLLGVAAWRWPNAVATRILAPTLAAAGLLMLPLVFDARTERKIITDSGAGAPDLAAVLETRPGAVLWLDVDEIFYWVHRANWNSKFQGAGLVFAPELARIWYDRANAVIAAGLAAPTLIDPEGFGNSPSKSNPDPDKVRVLCRRPDAPAWIVAPLDDGIGPPEGFAATIWTAPAERRQMYLVHDKIVWKTFRRYAIIPCAPGMSGGSP